MNPNAILIGDLVEVHADELTFEAVVKDKQPKIVTVQPLNPIVYRRRHCDYTQILKVLERPAAEEVAG